MKALRMKKWAKAKKPKERRISGYVLRQRDCTPPRLTTKTAAGDKGK